MGRRDRASPRHAARNPRLSLPAPLPPAPRGALDRLRDRARARVDEARAECAGKWWQWRAPLLAYLLWAGIQYWRDPDYSSLFGGLTFGIHELGHVVMSWGGHF